ncbi:aminotransferase class V-fold PLP-dependent enzyme [Herbiconiux sp. CPCC 205716]|uniref:Aminotransferase class V-fold PLP-dependent enzyme n=1 Tax=Herbiconiux gentiana TaxID=2970912 RepID=A0ABT2GI63_9MICO|nr:aminotransferase class V-fold PLP-dependent enzyme [Herbiconiux gentiana]MCS5715919.1 aminotransferase class V-fold PLP-dependent enzyme [Herbiconiux gentiana]
MTLLDAAPALSVAELQQHFDARPGYLSACMVGVPPRETVAALTADLAAWAEGHRAPGAYGLAVEQARAAYAELVGVPVGWVATGSQVSATAGMVAASLPEGSEVLLVEGDFSSMVFPFLVQQQLGRISVRCVPVEGVAESIRSTTTLVSFSLVQSATGAVADADAIVAAAERHGAATFCDTTQACGWMPVDASRFDVTVCHSYKWLCAPRGASLTTVRPSYLGRVQPLLAGWYSGDDVWGSCYGPAMQLAPDARRLDLSPAWPVWIGAAASLELFASADLDAVRSHCVGLAASLRARLRAAGVASVGSDDSAIVTWPDADGRAIAALTAADVAASARSGRCRVAFHVWNTPADVELVVAALEISSLLAAR